MTGIRTVAGIECRHRPASGGPDVAMLHGIGSNLGSFDRLSALLPESWGLLAWNAPGYGASTPLDDPSPRAVDYAERLNALLDALGIGPAVLVGHSLGTLMSVAFAGRWPERVSGIALFACAQGHGAAKGQLGEKAQARLDDLAKLGAEQFARTRAPRLVYEPADKPEVTRAAIESMAAVNPGGYSQAVHMLASGDLAGSAVKARRPSLVVVGAEDIITPPAQSRAVHAALSAASPDLIHDFAEIPGCGHLVHQEDPGAVAALLANFVETIEAKRRGAA